MSTPVVECIGVSKTYQLGFLGRKRVAALKNLSLRVEPGEVFGLIGPNGAGKSTTIKVLLNLVFASEGEARLFGVDVKDPRSRLGLGFVPEAPVPYEHLTAREYVELQGRLAGLSGAALTADVKRVLTRVEMNAHANMQIRRYSKGMVQRTMVAGALLGTPKLLILDEPTSGLDPLGRRLMRDIILEQRRNGVAVLFCTHIISDVESLCDRVALLVGGTLVRSGSVDELVAGRARIQEVVVEDVEPEKVRAVVGETEKFEAVGRRVLFSISDDRLQATLAALIQAGFRVSRVQPTRFSLEDAFMETLNASDVKVGGTLE